MAKAFLKQIYALYDHEISLISAVAFLVLLGRIVVMCTTACWNALRRVLVKPTHKQKTATTTNNVLHSPTSPSRVRGMTKCQIASTLILLLIATEIPLLWIQDFHSPKDNDNGNGLFTLIKGTDPRLDEILKRVPAIREGPRAPWWLRNRHIQFIPWLLQNEWHRQQGIPFERIHVPVTDCYHKTTTPVVDTCRRVMNDTITLDVFPPFADDTSSWNHQIDFVFNRSSPIIFFSPGLRCHSQDMPGNMVIRKAYEQGFRSVVVHRRGHTPNQKL